MDNYEFNGTPEQEPAGQEVQPEAVQEPLPSAPYSGTGTGRKESPYANSPYVAYERPRREMPPYEPPKKKPRKTGVWKKVAAVVLVIAVLGGLIGGGVYMVNRQEQKMADLNRQIAQLQKELDELESTKITISGSSGPSRPADGSTMTPAQVYEACVDSVVAISSTVRTQSFYGITEGTATGSGFVLTQDGYIVTNYHVVEGASKIEVTLHDGESYEAKLVGNDNISDMAVLKVEAEGLPAVTLGSGDGQNIGDMVVAIGNPLGTLNATQTVGYISGVDRQVTTDNSVISMIQTDCAINSGNSGGPLFNMYGEVIGITTAKYSGTTNSGVSIEGIGFAIPIADVMDSISDLVDHGYVTSAYLGITAATVSDETTSDTGITGVRVVSVEPGYCAEEAGVKKNDIITDLGGHEVENYSDLVKALRTFKAGDTTTITVWRLGQTLTLDITLDEKPQETEPAQGSGNMPSSGDYDEWYDFFYGDGK